MQPSNVLHFSTNEKKRHRPELPASYPKSDKFADIEQKVNEEIARRTITTDHIYKTLPDLSIDEYIWFQKHIEIRDNIKEENEEKYILTNAIYQKYKRLIDTNYRELEQLKHDAATEISLTKKIIDSEHPQYVKTILFKKYKLFCENHESHSEEYSRCMEWIDTVINIPLKTLSQFSGKSDINLKLHKLHNSLSVKIYGLETVKEKIMEAMCCKILNSSETSGKIITLIGAPGVGKTSIASTIADALDMPFDQISFGSIQDSKILTGHSSTYIGAVPGLFTKILIKSKRLDTIILLDEIDKITNSQDSNITSVLFHVLDKSQNSRFKDIYIPEVPLDLSKIIFLCAANNIEKIDPILRDRMTKIFLPGYTISDKVNIAVMFLVPKFKQELMFDQSDIIIENKELEYLISTKTEDQPGMRDVERKLRELFERLALLKYSNDIKYSFAIKNIKFPIKITTKIIDALLPDEMTPCNSTTILNA